MELKTDDLTEQRRDRGIEGKGERVASPSLNLSVSPSCPQLLAPSPYPLAPSPAAWTNVFFANESVWWFWPPR